MSASEDIQSITISEDGSTTIITKHNTRLVLSPQATAMLTKHLSSPTKDQEPRRLLKIDEVSLRTGRKKSRIYQDIRLGTFPAPIKDGRNASWDSQVIEKWITALLARGHSPEL